MPPTFADISTFGKILICYRYRRYSKLTSVFRDTVKRGRKESLSDKQNRLDVSLTKQHKQWKLKQPTAQAETTGRQKTKAQTEEVWGKAQCKNSVDKQQTKSIEMGLS